MKLPVKDDIIRVMVQGNDQHYIVMRILYNSVSNGLALFTGDFIAGDIHINNPVQLYTTHPYDIVDEKELPLLMGYKYTSELLTELLRGD